MKNINPEDLKNRYYIIRHGRSKANEAGIILSRPADGTTGWGLTAVGKKQAEASAESCSLPGDTMIFSSDFQRARETAEIIRKGIGASQVILTEALRERYFGEWDKTPDTNYNNVWEGDNRSGDNNKKDVESPNQVFNRVWGLIEQVEENYEGQTVLFVSHGDALQILQTGFAGIPPKEHRSLNHLETAEVRALNP